MNFSRSILFGVTWGIVGSIVLLDGATSYAQVRVRVNAADVDEERPEPPPRRRGRWVENPNDEVQPPRVASFNEMMRLMLEDGQLVLRTSLPGTTGSFRMTQVTVQDFPGMVQVRVIGESNDDQQWLAPQQFYLSASNQTQDGRGRHLAVNVAPGLVSLNRTLSSQQQHRTVRLTQTTNPHMLGFVQEPVVLSVTIQDTRNRSADTQNYPAASFEELRRKWPQEVDEHLRPMLQELGQEHLFAVDPYVGWQVFSDAIRPDPRVERAVLGLIGDLGHDDYKTRDRASEQIARMGHEAALVVMRLDRDKLDLDLEQRSRLDALLAPYRTLSDAEALKRRDDPTFLMDCLCGPDVRIRAIALQRLQRLLGEPLNVDINADDKTRFAEVARLRSHVHQAAQNAQK